ncbi:DUF1120 domain-containing protein [Cupriavidus agavae]|uniref:Uncharacterized protein DUF1120 n=1 Tax=Cupriavidus agavae TaxID=1001822 RepID=A0A4Q7RH06_9BURK|nr:DUF1120 domain-containing protein [Cupriavidus agavae]RZT32464.1 uncharacterized protein DUF1120 [Cupriavidus agavae]
MHRSLLSIAIAAALGCCAITSFAVETADVTIGGTIRPTACGISLSASEIDFGTIPVSALSATAVTNRSGGTTVVSIVCDGPSRFAIQGIDNRAGTAKSPTNVNRYGFGLIDGKPLGDFVLRVGNALGDGEAVSKVASHDEGSTWTSPSGNWFLDHAPTNLLTWGETGSAVPKAFTTVQVPLTIDAQLQSKKLLPPITTELPLDGLATIALIYL